MSRTGSTRSWRWPTAAPCCATAGWRRTGERGAFAVADLVQAMTGRAETGVAADPLVPGDVTLEDAGERPDAIRLRANEVLGLAGLLGSGADRVLRRLFGLDAGSERRAHQGRSRAIVAPDRRDPRRHRHGAGRAPAWSRHEPVGARQHPAAESRPPDARRPHRPRRGRPARRRADGAARHPAARRIAAGGGAVGRQPAEGDPRQMARAQGRRAAARRADPGRRRRGQGADPRADPRLREARRRRAAVARAISPS